MIDSSEIESDEFFQSIEDNFLLELDNIEFNHQKMVNKTTEVSPHKKILQSTSKRIYDQENNGDMRNIILNNKDRSDLERVKRDLLDVMTGELSLISEGVSNNSRILVNN